MVQLFLADKPEFQSTLPARGATRTIKKSCKNIWISIHAPRTGSDRRGKCRKNTTRRFQSTLPARGATAQEFAVQIGAKDFNPRSPHGERQKRQSRSCSLHHFNPRSPHGERLNVNSGIRAIIKFQSTLPARGATRRGHKRHRQRHFNPRSPHGERLPSRPQSRTVLGISIHAPRTGSDSPVSVLYSVSRYFNPRSPHGERL